MSGHASSRVRPHGSERLEWLLRRLQAKLERACRRLDMRLVPASSLSPSHALAAYAALTSAGWRAKQPPSASLPVAAELVHGSRELLFLEWRGCMVAMTTMVHAEVADGVRRSLSNVVSLPRGSSLSRFDAGTGGFVSVPGVYLGGGGLTVHALVIQELRRIAELDAGPRVDWVDAFPRLTALPGLPGAECEIQQLLDDAGFELFVLCNPSSYYDDRRELLAESCLITGTEALDPEAPIYLPACASLQAAIVQLSFTRAFAWAPPIITSAPRHALAPARPELRVQEFSSSSSALWVSASAEPTAVIDRLRRQIAAAVSGGNGQPRKAVMINVANHPANIPVMAALESWGCVPVGILPRWNGRAHRLCWSALHPDEQRQLAPPRLAPRLATPALTQLVDRLVQRRATTRLADPLLTPEPARA